MHTTSHPRPTPRSRSFRYAAGAVGLVALLGATACQSDDGAYTPGSDAPTDGGTAINPDGAPPPVFSAWEVPDSRIDAALDALPGLIESTMEETGIPGMAVAVVHDGEVVFAEGFGTADMNTGAPVDADTTFQLASISKSVGATVVSEQVTQGTIGWDDPIIEHLPGFELSDPYVTANVSYADLYSHRSGLPDHAGDALEDLGYDREAIIERLRFVPLDAFRATNHYTNFGLTAAAQAAANAAGLTWEDLSRTALYAPLAMDRTTSRHDELSAQDNRARLHVRTDAGWEQLHDRDPDAQSPAGGVSSSANDMATWMNFLLAGGEHDGVQLIDEETMATMLSPHSAPPNPPASLDSRAGTTDLGFNASVNSTGHQVFSHSGAFALGAGTTFTIVPAVNLGIITLTNGSPLGAAEAINAEFLDLALVGSPTQPWRELFGQAFESLTDNPTAITEPPPTNPAPAQALSTYAGTYANDFAGPATVIAAGDTLTLEIGANATSYPLTHWDGDQFAWTPPGENGLVLSLVTFDPAAATMTIASLDEVEGLGVFTR